MGAFIHPLTDWGFKRIFGDKELLMDFLNSLLEGERVITDLQYLNTELLPEDYDGRCTTSIARRKRESTSSWRCRTVNRISSRTGPCITWPNLWSSNPRKDGDGNSA